MPATIPFFFFFAFYTLSPWSMKYPISFLPFPPILIQPTFYSHITMETGQFTDDLLYDKPKSQFPVSTFLSLSAATDR